MIYISFYFLFFFFIFRRCRVRLNVGFICVQAKLKLQIQRTQLKATASWENQCGKSKASSPARPQSKGMWYYINYAWAALKNDRDTQEIMHIKYVRNVWIEERQANRTKEKPKMGWMREGESGRNMRKCGQNVCMFWANKLNEFKQKSSSYPSLYSPPFWQVINPKGMRRKNPKKTQAKSRHKTAKRLESKLEKGNEQERQ